ncbi:MAG: hypothetical protein ACOYNZ_13710 [Rhodoferax sp.]
MEALVQGVIDHSQSGVDQLRSRSEFSSDCSGGGGQPLELIALLSPFGPIGAGLLKP